MYRSKFKWNIYKKEWKKKRYK